MFKMSKSYSVTAEY